MAVMTTQLRKWGNSLAVRIPKAVAQRSRISEQDQVEVASHGDGTITIRRAEPKLTLENLVSRISTKNLHHGAEWGSPVGKEVW